MNEFDITDNTISQLNSILSSAQNQFNSDPNDFIAQDCISSLSKYISIVTNSCYLLNLSSYDKLKEYFKNPSFSALRTRWNYFLSEVDNQSILSSSYPTSLPSDVQLLDVNNNELINLESIYASHDRTLFVFLRHLA
jgi:hypothetical protein